MGIPDAGENDSYSYWDLFKNGSEVGSGLSNGQGIVASFIGHNKDGDMIYSKSPVTGTPIPSYWLNATLLPFQVGAISNRMVQTPRRKE